jgi:hypothetical protein
MNITGHFEIALDPKYSSSFYETEKTDPAPGEAL